jgi:signal transduction histidine kinase/CheY-like chemotaxis protein
MMRVRRRSNKRFRWPSPRRIAWFLLRWFFITIGAFTTAYVLLSHLHAVNSTVYDPALFAIGVSGLFAMLCGILVIMVSRNARLRFELRRACARCEELADYVWELKDVEERTLSLLEAQGDVIVRRAADGRITYANDAFCALAGKPREVLVGHAAELPVQVQGKTDVMPDGSRLYDQQIMTAAGARWIAWREVKVASGKVGELPEIQSVGRDVTDRTQAGHVLADARDQAEAASRAKSRFLAMVSHEIRTPLTGILGMTDLLLDTPLTPEQTTYVKAAKSSGDALLSLIEEILDFSKIEAGKLELSTQLFSLTALVEEAVELLAPRAQAKGLRIASDVDERVGDRVIGDATRLRQVLLNLAGNAIKFTEHGGVGITVGPGSGDGLVIEVCDTGIGIAPEEQARIFLEFEQAEGGAARKFGGTGLGLAICKRIIERMGGSITIESAPGAGTAVRVTLALPRAEQPDVPFVPPPLAGKSVLIAAPESIETVLLTRKLERWGARVVVDDKAVAGRWDCVLVDHAVADRMKPVAGVHRIVLITPGERHRLDALRQAGFTGYLVKPIRTASLAGRLTAGDAFDALPGVAEPTHAITAEGGRRSLSILVAEDNEINALLARSLLAKLGHRPAIVPDGAAAVEAWRMASTTSAPYDLVLMDLQMPGIDGLQATRQIRAAEAERSEPRTPIIALTANAFAEDRIACVSAGMDGFLVKPLNRERLAEMLASLPVRSALAA